MVTTTRSPSQRPVNNGRDPSCAEQAGAKRGLPADDDVLPYGIKKGDTLTDIAKAHDTTVDELLELNPALKAQPNKLRIGQQIDVPGADSIDRHNKLAVDDTTQRSSRQRAMSADNAARARIDVPGPYAVAAPSFADIQGAGARMRRGMGGESVKDLQRRLNEQGAQPPLALDGKFGSLTERALQGFQGDHGVQQTGVLGGTTLAALEQAKPRLPGQERVGAPRAVALGDLQGGSKAAQLASIAERTANSMGTTGQCALGVNNSLIAAGLASERGHAYQKADQLARDVDFQEVGVPRDQLAALPPGAVVVWGRSSAKPYGHVTVSLGDGREASDHVQRMIVGGRYGTDFGNGPDPLGRQFRVFMPMG